VPPPNDLPRYDILRTYDWNYEHAPAAPALEIPPFPGRWDFCGLPVDSPLGIPAGPLLNSRWIRYYAALGFDVLTYKTVRSMARPAFALPNLLPVRTTALAENAGEVSAAIEGEAFDSWAISFGMPSKDPAVWQDDVAAARSALRPGQVLVVSVTASPEPGWSIPEIAADYARCVRWAVEAGAQAVELNLSCPNVASAEAEVFLSPEASRRTAAASKEAAGRAPVVLKVGAFAADGEGDRQREDFLRAVAGFADAVSTTNTIPARVRGPGGEDLFGGRRRGIGGAGISERCFDELRRLRLASERAGIPIRLIAVGGISSPADIRARLDAGAHAVQLATVAMLDPAVALRIRREWNLCG
jgi:dihydroorotate dehydrogenase